MRILTVPGYTNSGPDHWQTLWERRSPMIERVAQRDWERPSREEWVATFDRAIRRSEEPVVVVAHSLGCAVVAHWFASEGDPTRVPGALLVAPADVDEPGWPPEVVGFKPMPLARLNAETTLVASRDDPWVSLDRARTFAERWGSRFVDVGAAGHLDSAAGLADWPDGWRLLDELLERCALEVGPWMPPGSGLRRRSRR